MRFAYADPPYLGQARRYSDRTEINHRVLIGTLRQEYPDGWALSCSSPSLQLLLPMCPSGTRILAWTKPFAAYKPWVHPTYAWEPVLLHGGRPRPLGRPVYDYRQANRMQKGFTGAKPEAFCRWLFDCFNAKPGDILDDLFPGTGAVGQAWHRYIAELDATGELVLHQEVLAL